MATATFDTLRASRALQAAGIERGHAEAIAEVVGLRGEDYATKADIAELRAEMRAEIANMKVALFRGGALAVGIILAGVTLIVGFLA